MDAERFRQQVARVVSTIAFSRKQFEQYAEGQTLEHIEACIEADAFLHEAKVAALEWVATRRRETADAAASEEKALLERSTKAAEQSAEAAANSARWALWAVALAAAALIVSAWPYIAKIGR